MAALAAGVAAAQVVSETARLPEAGGTLACQMEPIKPVLNFGFRFQAGYVFRVPLSLYEGRGHHWDVVFGVTPDGGQPVYFKDGQDLPVARADSLGEMRGSFLVGEGRYRVTWSLRDDLGRVCRKEWELEARAARNEQVLMPRGTVADLSWRPVTGAPRTGYPQRITLVVNASLPAGVQANQSAANGSDSASVAGGRWATLVSMVAAVLERLTPAAVRVVVIDLDQQREVWRQDGFTLDGMSRVFHAADGLAQWAVDYRVLQHPAGAWDLLANVVNRETKAAEPADAVVFAGLPWRTPVKMPAGFPGAKESGPRFFYLQYRTVAPLVAGGADLDQPGRRGRGAYRPEAPPAIPVATPVGQADAIDQALRRVKGKTLAIYFPKDLGRAIQEIEQEGK